MARLAAAFGTSHSPALNSPAQDFSGHAERDTRYAAHLDRNGVPVTYAQLLAAADPALADQCRPEVIAARVAACAAHLDRLAAAIAAARLDALVIVGDDQREQYHDDNMPAFLVYCGETIANAPLELPAGAPEYWRRARSVYHEPGARRDYPVAAGLAQHLVERLIEAEFDVASARTLRHARGEGHAFGFVHRRLMPGDPIPVVPIVVNTYYPPNQPRPRRCLALGRALRAAIDSWPQDARIGVIASGGLSHFTVDEALDRAVLDACARGDGDALGSLPPAKLNSGSSEIRNWIVTAGAAAGLATVWQEYVPLYRTPAGTGCGMAFAVWG